MLKVTRKRKLLYLSLLSLGLSLSPSYAYAQDVPSFLMGDDGSLDTPAGNKAPPGISALPPSGPIDSDVNDDGFEQNFEFDKSTEDLRNEIRSEAFEAALEGLLPLKPEEIRILLEQYDRTQEAVEIPIYPDPKPEFVVETIPMDPGSQPLRVKTAQGHVTTLSFIDNTGQPWPIVRMAWAGEFDILETTADEDEGENTIRIMPRSDYAKGNVSIDLLNLRTPVIMILETNRDAIHYRYDAIVPEFGPFAKTPLISQGITLTAGRQDISSMLQGVIPSSAKKLNIYGTDGRTSAYDYNGLTYLRTPLTLLSPGWNNSTSSADGMRIYEIQNTPVVLLSDRGKMVRVNITDREIPINE